MTVTVERLVATLEARIDKYEKNLSKASKQTDHSFKKIERRGQAMSKSLMVSFTKAGGALAAVLAPAAIAQSVRRLSNEISELGRSAERAGLGVEAFQELGFVAEQNRIPIDALTDGLKELQLRADEFIVTGKGPAAEAFNRLGIGADDLKEKLAEPRDLFIDIVGRMQQLDSAAQIRIADEIFGGTAGERFVELLDTGATKIREQIQLANDLGLVMDEDLIARADELDRKFALVSRTVGTALKSAIVDAASALAQFVNSFRAFEKQSNRNLTARIQELDERISLAQSNEARQVGDLSVLPRNLQDATLRGTTRETSLVQIRRELAEMQAERAEIEALLDSRTTPEVTVPTLPPWEPPSRDDGNSGGGRSRRSSLRSPSSALQDEIRAITERTTAIQAETAAMAQLNPLVDDHGFAMARMRAEMELMTAAQRDGIEITPELRATISELSGAYAEAEAGASQLALEQSDLRTSMEDLRDTGKNVLGGFINDLRSGKSAAEALANALDGVIDRLLNSALDGLFSGNLNAGGGDLIGTKFTLNLGDKS